MTGVTGQRHDFMRPHPPERHSILMGHATRSREHVARCVIQAVAIALRAPLDVPGIGRVVAHEYGRTYSPYHYHHHSAAAMATLATGNAPPPLPVALSLAPVESGGVVWIRTREQWRRVRDTWRARKMALHSRAAVAIRDAHDQLDRVAGITPIRDDDGHVLPGLPATEGLVAREALWTRFEREYFSDLAGLASRIGEVAHPAPGAVSTDIGEVRTQHLEWLDDAAAEQRRWILDDPDDVAHGPAHVAQETALRLLESRRQAGRRALRAVTTLSDLGLAATIHLALIRGAGVADGPHWQVGTIRPVHSTTFIYAAPTTGRWSQTVRAIHPSRPEALPANELGAIVLDDPAPPAGWTVTSTHRAAPHSDERDVTIAWAGDEQPEVGSYVVDITARNAVGPSRLVVTIIVPEPTTPSEG